MKNVDVIILTYNEERHIKRCIESVLPFANKIYVMDSFSTDSTLDILSTYKNVSVQQQTFVNYATQFNAALDAFEPESEWLMRLDADEYVDAEFSCFLSSQLDSVESSVNALMANRFMTFMGKLLEHGGMADYWMLRLWRNGLGRSETTWMDEHIILSEPTVSVKLPGRLIDDNLNNLSWWATKHVNYSTREAIDVLLREEKECCDTMVKPSLFGAGAERVRFLKNLYNRMPLFTRPFFYFVYRYFVRLGFLDGKQGFLWCILQGFWYRMMVDAKLFEIKSTAARKQCSVRDVVKDMYGYEI